VNESDPKPGASVREVAGGFTLIELLIVITIVAVLAALLVPSVSDVWEASRMTHCQSNLYRIYQAQALWRAEHQGRLLTGSSWMGNLLPYVDNNPDVFKCQTRVVWGYSAPEESEDFEASAITEEEMVTEVLKGKDETEIWRPPSEEIDACFEFDVYWQEGSTSITDGGSNSGIRGQYLYSIPLGNHPWVRRTDYRTYTNYKIDDEGTLNAGRASYDDLEVNVYYRDGQPDRVVLLRGQQGGSVDRRFIFDFKVFGKVVIRDVAGQERGGKPHWGEVIDLAVAQPEIDGTPVRWEWTGSSWTLRATETVPMIFGQPDPRLIYILDFGARKTVADFNHGGNTEDDWDKFFILDPETWQQVYREEGRYWRAYQSLRHFGKANVLFCDGHIEALGPEELYYNSPLWYRQGL